MTPGFLTPVRLEIVDDNSNDGRGSWQVLEDVRLWSDVLGGTLLIPAGFIYDLASVPRWPITGAIFIGRASRAALPHDWLYWTHAYPRDLADRVFEEMMYATGVPCEFAEPMFRAVQLGGGHAWDAPGQLQPPHIMKLLAAFRRTEAEALLHQLEQDRTLDSWSPADEVQIFLP